MKLLPLISTLILFSCTTTKSDVVGLEKELDSMHLKIYNTSLVSCSAFTLSCMSEKIAQQAPANICLNALTLCIKQAEDLYKKDTGKNPPGLQTQPAKVEGE